MNLDFKIKRRRNDRLISYVIKLEFLKINH